ncbi:hypothetical protein FRC09_016305 [Ceratobasidium sp. 395]|nr:hypothetical protein FRC09_016305 [Ceratobasidium sp. 395]
MELSVEAAANMRGLDRLDEQLSVIHEIITMDDAKIKADKQEVLSKLWTTLGGNSASIGVFESHTELLKRILDYREAAMKHVTSAKFQLERLAIGLNDLNDQVTIPLLKGEITEIPLDVHIRIMQMGTARLVDGRAREHLREDMYMLKALGSGQN